MIASASAAMCVGVALWRGGAFRVGAPDKADVLLAEGAREYATIATARVETRESIAAALEKTTFVGAPTREQREQLLREVADFLYYRFGKSSPAAYRSWRLSNGYEPVPLAELLDPWHIDRSHEIFFGEPLPADAEFGALFDKFCDASASYEHGHNRLVGVASVPKGLCCAVGSISRANPRRPAVAGELGVDLWYGRMSATMRRWWRRPRQGRELLESGATIACAEFGIVAEYADRSRRPLVLTFLFDPIDRRWVLEHVVAYNCDIRRVSALEY